MHVWLSGNADFKLFMSKNIFCGQTFLIIINITDDTLCWHLVLKDFHSAEKIKAGKQYVEKLAASTIFISNIV